MKSLHTSTVLLSFQLEMLWQVIAMGISKFGRKVSSAQSLLHFENRRVLYFLYCKEDKDSGTLNSIRLQSTSWVDYYYRKTFLQVGISLDNSQRTCEANPAGEKSSFIFKVCVKYVPLYHFRLAYLVLHMAGYGCQRIFWKILLKMEK